MTAENLKNTLKQRNELLLQFFGIKKSFKFWIVLLILILFYQIVIPTLVLWYILPVEKFITSKKRAISYIILFAFISLFLILPIIYATVDVLAVAIIAGIILLVFIAKWCADFEYNRDKKFNAKADAYMEEGLNQNNFEVSKDIKFQPLANNMKKVNARLNFLVDDKNKKFAIFYCEDLWEQKHEFKVVNYSDLINFNLYDDGEQQLQGRGMMSAVGAITFGVAGAVVGSVAGNRKVKNKCNELSIHIQINDLQEPLISIIVAQSCNRNTMLFGDAKATADNIIATLTYIENNK